MGPTIDTGGEFGYSRGCDSAVVSRTNEGTPNMILFDGVSTSVQSDVFIVSPRQIGVLVAYDIPDGISGVVEGVTLRSIGYGTTKCPGLPDRPLPIARPTIEFRRIMNLGGKIWQVTNDNPRCVIVVPGCYILTLSDQSAVGETIIEVQVYNTGALPMPTAYLAGV